MNYEGQKKILDVCPTEARNAVFTWCCRALLWVLMIGYIFLIVAACNFMAEILLFFPVNNSIECNCFVNALSANCRRGGLNKGVS